MAEIIQDFGEVKGVQVLIVKRPELEVKVAQARGQEIDPTRVVIRTANDNPEAKQRLALA